MSAASKQLLVLFTLTILFDRSAATASKVLYSSLVLASSTTDLLMGRNMGIQD